MTCDGVFTISGTYIYDQAWLARRNPLPIQYKGFTTFLCVAYIKISFMLTQLSASLVTFTMSLQVQCFILTVLQYTSETQSPKVFLPSRLAIYSTTSLQYIALIVAIAPHCL